jgi:hypothetical protein
LLKKRNPSFIASAHTVHHHENADHAKPCRW